MSADNGYYVQYNSAGQVVVQHGFASVDSPPNPDEASENEKFATLNEAIAAYEQDAHETEYGFWFLLDLALKEEIVEKVTPTAAQTQKYLKKPVPVDAAQFHYNGPEIVEWLRAGKDEGKFVHAEYYEGLPPTAWQSADGKTGGSDPGRLPEIRISQRDGTISAFWQWWIVRDWEGNITVLSPENFDRMYGVAGDDLG